MSTYTGSLLTKRKAELVEIAQGLGLSEPEAKMSDLIKNIQSHLDANETALMKSPMYKGLYVRKRLRHTDSDASPSDAKNAVDGAVKKSRKSLNKAIDKLTDALDPANIALPESPINVNRISENAQQSVSKALVPAQNMQQDVTIRARKVSNAVVKFGRDSQHRVDYGVRTLRDYLSNPEHIVASAVTVELGFLLCHVVQFYDHTIFFPPPGGSKGTFSSLLHGLFFWMPQIQLSLRLPETQAFGLRSDVWPAVSWWASTTILPALAMSTLISFVRQRGVAKTGHSTRYAAAHPPAPTPDPLTFALFRFALLLYPLTSAASSSIVDALEMSGNLQGRALGAGLLAMLMLAERLQPLH